MSKREGEVGTIFLDMGGGQIFGTSLSLKLLQFDLRKKRKVERTRKVGKAVCVNPAKEPTGKATA